MSRVNPPPHTSLPKKLAEILGGDREAVKYFSDRDFIQFQLWKRTGGGDDAISTLSRNRTTSTASALFDLENRLGSGDALTSDETGFTVDSTQLTVDMTEA
jgi:hypothetical protein